MSEAGDGASRERQRQASDDVNARILVWNGLVTAPPPIGVGSVEPITDEVARDSPPPSGRESATPRSRRST